ncbi:methenyltetrahydrofolate synthase domain-containing protein [Halyomorpha halys]|uniref:methenyltetrahydrofolate synthase domain-containing protein n=1 Tax=Halyomorpha halys TaxID=286706 RepID=UPI0006D5211F|nr:methenyltetrahydrofolate synthase domain-containing protein isoform X1 [Halyomorpha halys]
MTAGEEIKPSEVESQLEKEVGKGNAIAAPVANGPETTKLTIRLQTWEKLESMDQVVFPRPCKFRIPRFKGENEAVEKLAQLEAFRAAKVVKVNLDKAHERVRLEVIQKGKSLIAGTPGLKEAVFLLMRPPMEANKLANRMAASRIGIRHLGTALDFSSGIKADLVVLGSVAVDKKGHRIGKGEGFTDLEYALLSKLGIIIQDAVIATVVHDLQVYEEFPDALFKPWDVPVDIIITPTQVIHVEKKLPRPELTWNLLSSRRVNDIPIIKQLLEKEQLAGASVALKEVDSEPEGPSGYWPPLRTKRRRFVRRRRLTSAPPDGQPRGAANRNSSAPPPRGRTFRRSGRRVTLQPQGSASGDKVDNNKVGMGLGRRMMGPPMRRIRRPRYTVDFSVRIDGLTSGIRIRELKAALFERNVRPVDISWRAAKGVALLHFAKPMLQRRPNQSSATNSVGMDEVVSMLQGLAIKSGDGATTPELKVEGVKPILRPSSAAEQSNTVIQQQTTPSAPAMTPSSPPPVLNGPSSNSPAPAVEISSAPTTQVTA